MNKEVCGVCGLKMATWIYMPSSGGENPFYCDDCVNRGCSCNHYHLHTPDDELPPELPDGIIDKDWKWIDDNTWVYIDEEGREYPCVEFDYDKKGFDIE